MPDASKPRPVKPQESSSLIILRREGKNLEVLMGQRGRNAVFGGVYVFPGGKVDRSDRIALPASELDAGIVEKVAAKPDRARAFAMAAVRETYEETGLLVTDQGAVGDRADGTWAMFRDNGIAPALSKLAYVGHAITPAHRPRRFNARFFLTWAENTEGEIGGSGELGNIGWIPVEAALELPTVDVTQFMLNRMLFLDNHDFVPPDGYPFFTYRLGKRYVRFR